MRSGADPVLVFFDIDATLIRTGGAGVKAMIDAGRKLHGPSFHADGIAFSGRLDPLILKDMLSLNGVDPTPAAIAAMRQTYIQQLPSRLGPGVGIALAGVLPLLKELESTSTMGLLTGNFAESGLMKLTACGIDGARFHIHVWGDDSPHDPPSRDHLPGVGLGRYRERFGRDINPGRVVVIGDTPHDVACARAHGCRSLGVATGQFSVQQLIEAKADRAVPDLSDTADIKRWLLG